MVALSGAKPEVIVRFLPLVFDNLLQLLVQPPRIGSHILNVGQPSFEAICLILDSISVSSRNVLKCFCPNTNYCEVLTVKHFQLTIKTNNKIKGE